MFTKNVKIRGIFYINIQDTSLTPESPLGIAEAKSEDRIAIIQWPTGIFAACGRIVRMMKWLRMTGGAV